MTEQIEKHKFVVVMKLVMPGQTRATTYEIPVVAECKLEALAAAENQWSQAVLTYDTEIREIRPAGKVQDA